MRYPITLTRDDNDTFLVTFPDIPGAVTYGDTIDEALARAVDALLSVFDALIKDRRDIPEPSEIDGPFVVVPALESAKIALYRAMREAHVNKTELGRRLDWHLPQVDRVLKIRHGSQLDQLEAAFAAVGKRIVFDTADLEPVGLAVTAVSASRVSSRNLHDRSTMRAGRSESARGRATAGRSGGTRKVAAKKR